MEQTQQSPDNNQHNAINIPIACGHCSTGYAMTIL